MEDYNQKQSSYPCVCFLLEKKVTLWGNNGGVRIYKLILKSQLLEERLEEKVQNIVTLG